MEMEFKSETDNIIIKSCISKEKKVKTTKKPLSPTKIINDAVASEVKNITDVCEVKNITDVCENTELIDINFKKCVQGYHLVNSSSINETIWEDINALIFLSLGINIYSKSDGSHSSGMDIDCTLGGISNKSAKYSNNRQSIDISLID